MELLKLLPGAIGFFMVEDYPGVILKDNQGWIFDGDVVPHPITRSEARQRGGEPIGIDEAAELFSSQPKALDFLKKNAKSSTGPINLATKAESLKMKERAVTKKDMFIPIK